MITQIDTDFIETAIQYNFINDMSMYIDKRHYIDTMIYIEDIIDNPINSNYHIPVLDKVEMIITQKSHIKWLCRNHVTY